MKRQWYFVLLSLAGGDRHGSGIMREVLDLTDGELRLWPATLYGSLEELSDQGWIEELAGSGHRPEGESERKRFYRLTVSGRQVLGEETERLAAIVREARARIPLRGSEA
jgi:DNA-binding PadR family transcriptional regulator